MNEYKYTNEMPVNMKAPEGATPVVSLMEKNCAIANEGLLMARVINSCLFGDGNPEEKLGSPSCFAEALRLQNYTLNMLLEELTRLSERLGV